MSPRFGDTEYFTPPIKFYSESAHWRHIYAVFPPVEAPRSLQPLGRSCQNYVYEKNHFSYNKHRYLIVLIERFKYCNKYLYREQSNSKSESRFILTFFGQRRWCMVTIIFGVIAKCPGHFFLSFCLFSAFVTVILMQRDFMTIYSVTTTDWYDRLIRTIILCWWSLVCGCHN